MIHILIYTEDAKHEIYFKEVFAEKVFGARLSVCKSPDEALAAAVREKVDLLIADLLTVRRRKTYFAGFEFLERFRNREEFRYIYLVILSDLEDEMYYSYNRLHSFGYYLKPLNEALFLNEIIPLCRHLERIREGLEKLMDPVHFFRRGKELLLFRESEVVRFELHTKQGLVVTMDRTYDVDAEAIRSDAGLVDSERFIKCSRSDYVNPEYVRGISRDSILLDRNMGRVYLTPSGRRNLDLYLRKLRNIQAY